MKPDRYQNDTSIGSNMKLSLVSNRYPNNTNLNITKATTTNREKDAVAAVVNFKKLKEKGEEKMLAIKEQLMDLDFEGRFIEQLLKNYPPRKIEEKLDLLKFKRNIQSPAGWLWAALKNDYQDPEQERYDEEPAEKSEDDKCRGTMYRAHIIPNVIANSDLSERGNLNCRGSIHRTRLYST